MRDRSELHIRDYRTTVNTKIIGLTVKYMIIASIIIIQTRVGSTTSVGFIKIMTN